MTHQVDRISRKMLFNTPLLVTLDSFEGIVEYVNSRPDGLLSKEELSVARDIRRKEKEMNIGEGSTAVLSVSGALTYEETFLGAICGMSSYQGLVSQMRQAVDEGYKTVVLDVDSGGGQAYGCFETARELRKMADDNDMRLIAYVDGISASAAYGLTSAAHEVIVNPESEVGSIGVLVKLQNDSEMMKNIGIKTTYVFAGDDKIPFDTDGEFREEFLEDIQVKVDGLYEKFTSHVAEARDIEIEAVKGTQAKVFSAEDALSLGLIDKVMERMEFAEYLADIAEEDKQMPLRKLFAKTEDNMSEELNEEVAVEEELQEEGSREASLSSDAQALAEMQAKLEEMEAELATVAADKAQMEEAVAAEAQAALEAKVADFSNFVDDKAKFTSILGEMSSDDQDVILGALEKASATLEDNVSEELAIEGEVEEEVELTQGEKDKQLTREKIKAKYALSQD